jgi:hypothetical protein
LFTANEVEAASTTTDSTATTTEILPKTTEIVSTVMDDVETNSKFCFPHPTWSIDLNSFQQTTKPLKLCFQKA